MLHHGILSTKTYDPDGWLEIEFEEQTAGIYDFMRQATIVKTLDGGVFVDSMGVLDPGRVLTVTTRVDDPTADLLADLCRAYERLNLATENGLYSVCPMQFGRTPSVILMQLHIIRRLDEDA